VPLATDHQTVVDGDAQRLGGGTDLAARLGKREDRSLQFALHTATD
jgi:hypothetical protein